MKISRLLIILLFMSLSWGCTKMPQGVVEEYDLGPSLAPSKQFIAYTRTYWDQGKLQRAYLKLHNLNSGTYFTIAGPVDDILWHPLEKMLYFLSDNSIYEINPDNFSRRHIYSLNNYDPPGEISLYGWNDGKTMIIKQSLPEKRPSGSYVILYDVLRRAVASRYFVQDKNWSQVPSGNQYKLTRTANGKISLLKDGEPLKKKTLQFPLDECADDYSLEIKYGSMTYEMPLLANGSFAEDQYFWDTDTDRLFFSSKDYFWRLDLKGLKLTNMGANKNIQKGIIKKWAINDKSNPVVVILEEELKNKEPEQEISNENIVQAYFLADALRVNNKGAVATFNTEAKPELLGLKGKYSIIDITPKGEKAVFSHAGRVGHINFYNRKIIFLTHHPRMKEPVIPAQ